MSTITTILPAFVGSGPIAPAWVVLPMALLALVVLGLHLQGLRLDESVPPSRRRVRTVNAVVMMATTISLAYSFALADPALDPRDFALSWMTSVGLLFIVLLMGLIDSVNNIRLHVRTRRRLRNELRESLLKIAEGRTGA